MSKGLHAGLFTLGIIVTILLTMTAYSACLNNSHDIVSAMTAGFFMAMFTGVPTFIAGLELFNKSNK